MRTVEMTHAPDSGHANRSRFSGRNLLVGLLWLAIGVLIVLLAFLARHLAARKEVVVVVLVWVAFGCAAFVLTRFGRRSQRRIRPSGPDHRKNPEVQ